MLSDFIAVLAQDHLSAPDPSKLIPNGSIIRLSDDLKGKRNTDGWCVGNVVEQGEIWTYGNWRLSETDHRTWHSFDRTKMTCEERNSLDQTLQRLLKEREKELSQARERAAEKAQEIWESSTKSESHPYLLAKDVGPGPLRLYQDKLIAPIFNALGELRSIQFINSTGGKRFLPDGQTSECFMPIEGATDFILICEGVATAISLSEVTGKQVYSAMNSHNLLKVAPIVKRKHPDSRIVICADNDHSNHDNPGLTSAKKVAEQVGCLIKSPNFDEADVHLSDWNDFHSKYGVERTREALTLDEPLPIVYPTNAMGLNQARIESITQCLREDPHFSYQIHFDEFFGQVLIHRPSQSHPERITDNIVTEIREWFGINGWQSIAKEMAHDCINRVAHDKPVDLMTDWLNKLPVWDGNDRMSEAGIQAQMSDLVYAKAWWRYVFSALVARQLEPGCKLDIVPILVGGQGVKKTQLAESIPPQLMGMETFGEITMSDIRKTETALYKVRAKAVLILDELRGFKKDQDADKAAITRRIEEQVPKYMQYSIQYPRRCLIIGTTNDDEFLDDPTGARRFAPIRVEDTINIDWFKANIEQLWAQGRVIYENLGEPAWKDLELLARKVHDEFRAVSWVTPYIEDFIKNRHTPFTTNDVIDRCPDLNNSPAISKKSIQMEIGKALQAFGYEKDRKQVDGKRKTFWTLTGGER
jgi:phage/plasmid primase-like uncharacterized protein